MEHPHEPIDAINSWQEWYKSNRVIASLDKPLESKDSREELHDTSKAIDSWLQTCTYNAMKQATDHFGDTIVEASASLSADEIYSCLLQAVQENYDHAKKEFDNAARLLDLIKNDAKTN
jgi:hypothetical protein